MELKLKAPPAQGGKCDELNRGERRRPILHARWTPRTENRRSDVNTLEVLDQYHFVFIDSKFLIVLKHLNPNSQPLDLDTVILIKEEHR